MVVVMRPCAQCGRGFQAVPRQPGMLRLYCGIECKHRASRRRQTAGGANQRRFQDMKLKRDSLKNAPCSDCVTMYDPVCMDWDHRPTETKFMPVSQMFAAKMSMELIMQEIAKCDLVCANCHRIRTKVRRVRQ